MASADLRLCAGAGCVPSQLRRGTGPTAHPTAQRKGQSDVDARTSNELAFQVSFKSSQSALHNTVLSPRGHSVLGAAAIRCVFAASHRQGG
eukprot:2457904-Pleurochrysis_carterae.AAC.4